MWHSYSNLPIAVVMLGSSKIPVTLVNAGSVSEQNGIQQGLQSRLGFSTRKAFA